MKKSRIIVWIFIFMLSCDCKKVCIQWIFTANFSYHPRVKSLSNLVPRIPEWIHFEDATQGAHGVIPNQNSLTKWIILYRQLLMNIDYSFLYSSLNDCFFLSTIISFRIQTGFFFDFVNLVHDLIPCCDSGNWNLLHVYHTSCKSFIN